MWTRVILSLALFGVGTQGARAQDAKKAAIQELQREIEALEKEQQAKIKSVGDLFQKIIHTDRLTEKEADAHRKHLLAERNHLLKLAGTEEEKHAIHRHFDGIIEKFRRKEHLEKKDIEELRAEEKHTIALMKRHYEAAIGKLRNEIELLKHQPAPKSSPKAVGKR